VALIVLVSALLHIAFYFLNPFLQGFKISSAAKEIHAAEQVRNYNSPIMNPKFTSLYSKNNDIIGWIKIEGTNIDYPVMQNVQDDFYLRKGFDKSYSREGSIFADGKTVIIYGKESKNIVLYGHNMISTGTMFRQLEKYLRLDFYKKRPVVMFDSLYRDSDYKIFAVFITNAIKSQDNGNYFDYAQNTWKSEQEFNNWIEEVKLRSVISTGVDVNYDDELLTLQTCNESFESEDEKARLVVMARRVRAGETTATDTSAAVSNNKAKYPQMWYDVNGLSNPYLEGEQPTTPPKPTKPTKTSATSTTTTTTTTVTSAATSTQPTVTTTKPTQVKTTKKPAKTTAKSTKPSKTTAKTTEPTVETSQTESENNE
ncbi:MAG: class B sortase, partial [Clostridia bacterium]|nr:class B sortase [Clostridia bacterium]